MPARRGESSFGDRPSDERVTASSLARALFELGALRLGDFLLPNGRKSRYDLDLRLVPSHPDLYTTVLAAYVELVDRVGSDKFDSIAGVVSAGVTVSSPLAIMLKKPMMYVRKPGDARGDGGLVEGTSPRGSRVLIIDDLVSSGSSMVAAAGALRKKGFRVTDTAVLVDRLEGGRANLEAAGVRLNSYSDIRELLRGLQESGLLKKDEVVRALEGAKSR